jgi:2-polyprenyl-3-methyl-5-hydroxy-6-metoxy-1,4-benzoquinol methylase
MPIGSWSAFQRIIQGSLATNPASVLDLGIGFGMNGCGIRNWLDMGYNFKTRLVGIEGFKKYKNPAWGVYDKIIIGDIRKEIHNLDESFDLILMTDVIEHFTMEEGKQLLIELRGMAKKAVIISTPAIFFEQGAAYGNDFEIHKSLWRLNDFQQLGYGIVMNGNADMYGHRMIVADYIVR